MVHDDWPGKLEDIISPVPACNPGDRYCQLLCAEMDREEEGKGSIRLIELL